MTAVQKLANEVRHLTARIPREKPLSPEQVDKLKAGMARQKFNEKKTKP